MTSRRATFFGAALMARSMDAGATVGMVLLALEVSDGTAHATLVGGLLGACLTLPHVAGPAAARVLSRFADVRVGILVFTLWYASCLVAAALGLGTLPLPGIAALLLCGGLAGPVLTGGLSSLVSANGAARRASSSLDALVYGLSGTLAPVAVSAVAVLATPRTAVVTLAVAGAAGGAMVLSLPRPDSRPAEGDRHDARHVLAFIAGNRQMRSVTVLTWLGAFVTAAAILTGISAGASLDGRAGGLVAGAFGLGGLVGGCYLIARPPRQDVLAGLVTTSILLGLCCVLMAIPLGIGPLIAAFALLGLANAPQSVFSLAARDELPPPHLRQDVFVTVAGSKVAFSSLGTATAGVMGTVGTPSVFVALAAVATAIPLLLAGTARGPHPS